MTDLLHGEDNIKIQSFNLLDSKKPLFTTKYPCKPKTASAPAKISRAKKLEKVETSPSLICTSKRSRKLPTRFAESLQGNEFEKIFNKQESQVVGEELTKSESSAVEQKDVFTKPKSKNRCDKTCSSKAVLDSHVTEAHDEGGDTTEAEITSLYYETNTDNTQIYTCKVCSRAFKSKTLVTRHLTSVHTSRGRPYECDKCDQKFKSSSNLKVLEHFKMHKILTRITYLTGTSNNSYRGKVVFVRPVRQALQLQSIITSTHEATSGRETIFLQVLFEKFHSKRQSQGAHSDPHWREAVCVLHVRQKVYHLQPAQTPRKEAQR